MPVNEHGQPVGDPVPGWRRRPLPSPVQLHGRHVRLEPLDPSHTAALLAHVAAPGDEALWTYRSSEMPADRAAVDSLVAADRADPSSTTFAVVASGQAQGLASYLRMSPGSGSIEIGSLLFGRAVQRTPVSTETTHLLLRHAFDDLGYRRVEWKCDALNEPSRAAALRLGFTYEGRFRHHVVVKGRNRDTDWFAIVASEWPAIRDAQARWLDPANFDEHGRQRVRLQDVPRLGGTAPDGPPVIAQTVLDTDDARGLAEFYRQLFGLTYRDGDEPPPSGEPDERGSDWLVLRNPGGIQLAFQQRDDHRPPTWGEETRPQQLHLDTVVESVEQLVRQRQRAEELGARVVHDRVDDPDEPLYVLLDPAGHPFCIFVS